MSQIVTNDQAKLYLAGLSNWSEDKNAILEGDESGTFDGLIDLCSGIIEDRYLMNKVIDTEVERLVDGSGTDELALPFWPIIELVGAEAADKLTNLQYRNSYDGAWLGLLDNVNRYMLDESRSDRIILVDGSTFPSGIRNIRVRWRAGYISTSVPATIQKVCLEMIAIAFRESGIGGGGLGKTSMSEAAAGGSVTTSFEKMSERWMTELAPWRRFLV